MTQPDNNVEDGLAKTDGDDKIAIAGNNPSNFVGIYICVKIICFTFYG